MNDEWRTKISKALKGNKNSLGHKVSDEAKREISIAHKGKKQPWSHFPVLIAEANPEWKGDFVSYRSLHKWVERWLGKANKCAICGQMKEGKNMHWANISHEYKRDLKDWISLCVKCHKKYDKKVGTE